MAVLGEPDLPRRNRLLPRGSGIACWRSIEPGIKRSDGSADRSVSAPAAGALSYAFLLRRWARAAENNLFIND
jgi:hypothetical protein